MSARVVLAGAAAAGLFLASGLLAGGGAGSQAAAACVSSGGGIVGGGTGPTRTPLVGLVFATSEFGWREFGGRGRELHGGLDLAASGPAPTVAARAGTVTFAGEAGGAGLMVQIDHGEGVETVYMHHASLMVRAGQHVTEGQQIGVQGNTGDSTGPHLHFEVHIAGQKVDPRAWLVASGAAVPAPGGSLTIPGGGAGPSTPAPTGTPTTAAAAANVPGFTPAQLSIAAVIVKVGRARGLDDRAVTLGVAVGITESSLTNLPHGDAARADTIGVFQIGPEHGTEAQRMDPAWSAGNFFDRLARVPGWESMEPTLAAHQAQRNADPYVYARQWNPAMKVVAAVENNPDLAAGIGAVCEAEDAASYDPATAVIP